MKVNFIPPHALLDKPSVVFKRHNDGQIEYFVVLPGGSLLSTGTVASEADARGHAFQIASWLCDCIEVRQNMLRNEVLADANRSAS